MSQNYGIDKRAWFKMILGGWINNIWWRIDHGFDKNFTSFDKLQPQAFLLLFGGAGYRSPRTWISSICASKVLRLASRLPDWSPHSFLISRPILSYQQDLPWPSHIVLLCQPHLLLGMTSPLWLPLQHSHLNNSIILSCCVVVWHQGLYRFCSLLSLTQWCLTCVVCAQ